MAIPNFGDSVPILDVDPELFFIQLNEQADIALAYDFQPSSDFEVVEASVDHIYKAWLNVPIYAQGPSGESVVDKLRRLSLSILSHFTVRTPKDLQRRYGAVLNQINYLHVLKC